MRNDADALIMTFAPLVQGIADGARDGLLFALAVIVLAWLLGGRPKPSSMFAGGRRSREAMLAATQRQAQEADHVQAHL